MTGQKTVLIEIHDKRDGHGDDPNGSFGKEKIQTPYSDSRTADSKRELSYYELLAN